MHTCTDYVGDQYSRSSPLETLIQPIANTDVANSQQSFQICAIHLAAYFPASTFNSGTLAIVAI